MRQNKIHFNWCASKVKIFKQRNYRCQLITVIGYSRGGKITLKIGPTITGILYLDCEVNELICLLLLLFVSASKLAQTFSNISGQNEYYRFRCYRISIGQSTYPFPKKHRDDRPSQFGLHRGWRRSLLERLWEWWRR